MMSARKDKGKLAVAIKVLPLWSTKLIKARMPEGPRRATKLINS
jgi:hypothetical protein